MAKTKKLKDDIVEFFSSIVKYFKEDKQLIVILPEGLESETYELEDDRVKLTMHINGLNGIKFVADFEKPKEIDTLVVLRVDEAKEFTT